MGQLVPAFPLVGDPGDWPVLTLLAACALLEAEGEPFEGILGVCWGVRRRAIDWQLGWHRAVLGPEGRAYDDGRLVEPISAFNDDYRARAMARLSAATPAATESSWKAAAAALWNLLPDPVQGASFYLNPAVTLKIRGGTFPVWAADPQDATKLNQQKLCATVGRHVFLKA